MTKFLFQLISKTELDIQIQLENKENIEIEIVEEDINATRYYFNTLHRRKRTATAERIFMVLIEKG